MPQPGDLAVVAAGFRGGAGQLQHLAVAESVGGQTAKFSRHHIGIATDATAAESEVLGRSRQPGKARQCRRLHGEKYLLFVVDGCLFPR